MSQRQEKPTSGLDLARFGARAVLALLVAHGAAFGREEKKEEKRRNERQEARQESSPKEQRQERQEQRKDGNRPAQRRFGDAPNAQPLQRRFGDPQPAQVHPEHFQRAPAAPFERSPLPAQGWRPPMGRVDPGRGGAEIHRGPDGALRELRIPGGGVIYHGPGGFRHVEAVRPGGRFVVAGRGAGYVQRPWTFRGQPYVKRTYVVGGVTTARVFRPWAYGGVTYQVYMPMHTYRPAFYRWAYQPWTRPVYYRWGWEGRPWYGYYGGYFTPYPTYASPLFWLTDFVLATTLETAYLSRTTVTVAYDAPQAPMPPDARQALSDEMRRQMDMEQDQPDSYGAASAPPPVFAPEGPRIFLVNSAVTAYAGNQEIPLAEGAVLQLQNRPAVGAEFAEVRVMSSRDGACPRGSYVYVRTMDLQEMQNHLHATLDQGMDRIQSGQGMSAFPAPPPQDMARTNAAFASEVKADDDALDELDATLAEAEKAERANLPPGSQGTAAPAPPPRPAPSARPGSIALGMSTEDVEEVLGQPRNTVDLGSRLIYVYSNLKVTFTDGKVTDVQ